MDRLVTDFNREKESMIREFNRERQLMQDSLTGNLNPSNQKLTLGKIICANRIIIKKRRCV